MSHTWMPRKSRFRASLMNVPVPQSMLEGIPVIRVKSSGKTRTAYLTLSQDRFTIYVTLNKFKHGAVGKAIKRPTLFKVTSIGSHEEDHDLERTIDLGSVHRVQRGNNTLRFELARKNYSRVASPRRSSSAEYRDLDPNLSLSLIVSGDQTLDLMVPGGALGRDEVAAVLKSLCDTYAHAKLQVGHDVSLLRRIWNDVDKDKSQTINSSEFVEVLNGINFNIKKSAAEDHYKRFCKKIGLDRNRRRSGLSFEQTLIGIHYIRRDGQPFIFKPVQNILFDLFGQFMNNGKERTTVSAESFLRKFFWKVQGEGTATIEEVGELFRRLNNLEVAHVPSALHLDQNHENVTRLIDKDRFEAYLFSEENDIFDRDAEKLNTDCMHHSLSAYWINSSHNTYLTGDQFQSQSSVAMYTHALHYGCRCLELDCFDGPRDSKSNKPIVWVYHMFTMTSRILFSDIIDVIKEFIDSNPDCYPIVLSLENHCSLEYQEAMAEYMTLVFGDSLYYPEDGAINDALPSPEELKGKILLKGRRITDTKEDYYQGPYDTESDDSEAEEDVAQDNKPLSPKLPVPRHTSSTSFSPELSRMTTFHGVKLNTFDESGRMSKDCMTSIVESKVIKLNKLKANRYKWAKYNQTHLSRVYPKGIRVNSSNFSATTAWANGCQLVALNIQTPDASRRFNDGRFRQNGNCGYVLKPQTLLSRDAPQPLSVSLGIKILCGNCLPKIKDNKKGINPYVSVSLSDISASDGGEIINSYRTQHVQNNGFNPIWIQDNSFSFKVESPDIAVLQISVWDRGDVANADDFVGSSSIPVPCVREGFRSVCLLDANNTRNGAFECASILVEVKMERNTGISMY